MLHQISDLNNCLGPLEPRPEPVPVPATQANSAISILHSLNDQQSTNIRDRLK